MSEVSRSVGHRLVSLVERLGSPHISNGVLAIIGIGISGSLDCTGICIDTVRKLSTTGRTYGNLSSTRNCLHEALKGGLRLEGTPRLDFITSSSVGGKVRVFRGLGRASGRG